MAMPNGHAHAPAMESMPLQNVASNPMEGSATMHPGMMQMAFYWGKHATILFTGWTTSSVGLYLLSLLALFIASFCYQYLERLTSCPSPLLSSPSSSWDPKLAEQSSSGSSLPLPRKLLLTALFGMRIGVADLLMLAVMSFNGGVFIAVILGFAAGFFVFRANSFASTRTPTSQSEAVFSSTAANTISF